MGEDNCLDASQFRNLTDLPWCQVVLLHVRQQSWHRRFWDMSISSQSTFHAWNIYNLAD